jgi:hypothetical protein
MLPFGNGLLDQQRVVADMAPLEGQRFAGPQHGVGKDADDRRPKQIVAVEHPPPDVLDAARWDDPYRPLATLARLAHDAHRVARGLTPFDGDREHRLQQHHGLADRLPAHSLRLHLGHTTPRSSAA